VSFGPNDYFSSLLKGSVSLATNSEDQISYGLAAAREVLKSYGDAPVSQEYPTERTLTLRVLLPIE
jgi:3-hydroxy-3-methylglutaryl CoA synthase